MNEIKVEINEIKVEITEVFIYLCFLMMNILKCKLKMLLVLIITD